MTDPTDGITAAAHRRDHERSPHSPALRRLAETNHILAAEIADVAARRVRELVAERPFEPEVLDRVAALLGPIPKARRHRHPDMIGESTA